MAEIIVRDKLFHLRNARMSYIFRLTGDGLPAHVYWGARLESLMSPLDRLYFESGEDNFRHNTMELEKLPQEYPTYGHGDLQRGALELTAADGSTAVDLVYQGHLVYDKKPALESLPSTFDRDGSSETVAVEYADGTLGLKVTLLYTIFEDCDVIARSARIVNAHERHPGLCALPVVAHERRRGALLKRLRHEFVPVARGARECHVEAARRDAARVEGDARERSGKKSFAFRACPGRKLGEGDTVRG